MLAALSSTLKMDGEISSRFSLKSTLQTSRHLWAWRFVALVFPALGCAVELEPELVLFCTTAVWPRARHLPSL